MSMQQGSCEVHAWRRKEEGGRRRKEEEEEEEKDGPLIRLASLINWN